MIENGRIPLEALRAVRTVVVHAHCPDGFASALLIKDALPNINCKFVTHDQLKTLPAEPGQIFCDIAPPMERAEEFAKRGVIVLDHHQSAKASMEAIQRVLADHSVNPDRIVYSGEPGVSGAVLAFRHVWLPLKDAAGRPGYVMRAARAQWFATLIGVRDTFQKDAPEWQVASDLSAAIMYRSDWLGDPCVFDESRGAEWAELEHFGFLLRQNARERTRRAAMEGFKYVTEKGTRVLIVQGLQTTELGEFTEGSAAITALGFEYPVDLVVGFMYRADAQGEGQFQVSMRSQGKVDVRRVAELYGGGGHTNAAGFTVPQGGGPRTHLSYQVWLSNPIEAIENLLDVAEV